MFHFLRYFGGSDLRFHCLAEELFDVVWQQGRVACRSFAKNRFGSGIGLCMALDSKINLTCKKASHPQLMLI